MITLLIRNTCDTPANAALQNCSMFRANRSDAAGCTEMAGAEADDLNVAEIVGGKHQEPCGVTKGAGHGRNLPRPQHAETAIIRTVEKIEPATMYPHSRGVAAKKVGSAQPTRMPL